MSRCSFCAFCFIFLRRGQSRWSIFCELSSSEGVSKWPHFLPCWLVPLDPTVSPPQGISSWPLHLAVLTHQNECRALIGMFYTECAKEVLSLCRPDLRVPVPAASVRLPVMSSEKQEQQVTWGQRREPGPGAVLLAAMLHGWFLLVENACFCSSLSLFRARLGTAAKRIFLS